MKSLVKNSFYNILYVILNTLFPLLTSMVVSRVLLAEGVGKVAYAQTFVSYFTTFASAGILTYGLREIAKNQDDSEKTSDVFSELLLLNFILTFLAVLIFLVLILCINSFRENIILYFVCGLHLFFNFINVDWLFKGKEEYGYIVLRSAIVKIISFICIVIFVKEQKDFIVYALLSSLALGGNNLFNIFYSRKYARFHLKNISISKHLRPVIIITLASFFGTIYNKIDITMLGIFSNDSAIGLYSNAHKSVNIIISLTTALTAVFMPRLSLLFNKEREEFSNALTKGTNLISLLSIPTAVGLCILAPYIVKVLYGESFVGSGKLLRTFSILVIIISFGDLFCYQTLIAIGYEKLRLICNIVCVFINITLNLIFIPIYNDWGAVIASILSEFLINFFLLIFVLRKIKFRFPYMNFFKSVLSAIVMGVAVYGITLLSVSNFIICLVGFVVGILVFSICSLILKNDSFILIVKQTKRLIKKGNK